MPSRDYDAYRERQAERSRRMSKSGRDIGPLPDPLEPERKAACRGDFKAFCGCYLSQTFVLNWSPDHLRVIERVEVAVLEGGLFAMAMPRGSGKTSICEAACLWALVYGHRGFVALIGADEEHADKMLESIKVELSGNDLLLADFPEVCYPIHALEGVHHRAAGQLYRGEPTRIRWSAGELTLPTIPGSHASGAKVQVAGITGRIRGMKHKRADGATIRPSLVLVDDPQTDETAASPSQCATRERTLSGAILGLAGPGKKIAGLLTLTVIRPDDMADRILDVSRHPQWQGERTKLVYAFPTNGDLWKQYGDIWRSELEAKRGTTAATAFYAANREAMDEGAVVAWQERYNPDELSAIQHAMNLMLERGDRAFFAEYQNEPLPETPEASGTLTAAQIEAKVNGQPRGIVPVGCSSLTMFVDVQGKVLYWIVAGWAEDFTGYVVDYGTEPDQKIDHFSLGDVKRTLQLAMPNTGLEGAIYGGLDRLCERLIAREWKTADGTSMRIDRCLIDANWGASTDVVKQFCRQSKFAGVVMPSHGKGVTASSMPFRDYKTKKGDRVGLNWRVPAAPSTGSIRHVMYDTNYWKTFLHGRLAVAMGDAGCLSLFGSNPNAHRMLAEHLTAEYPVRTAGRDRELDEWKPRVNRDNHLFDCLVGAAVAASMEGAGLGETGGKRPYKAQRRQVVSFSEMQRAARARAAARGKT